MDSHEPLAMIPLNYSIIKTSQLLTGPVNGMLPQLFPGFCLSCPTSHGKAVGIRTVAQLGWPRKRHRQRSPTTASSSSAPGPLPAAV